MEYALALATSAHAGQVDKGGRPYILHAVGAACRGVTTAIKLLNKRAHPPFLQDVWTIGVLHDVIEDTHHNEVSLLFHGIKERHVQGVEILSRRKSETYREYIRRVVDSGDLAAIFAKMGDVADHLAPERAVPGWKDYESIMRRDRETMAILTSAAWELSLEIKEVNRD